MSLLSFKNFKRCVLSTVYAVAILCPTLCAPGAVAAQELEAPQNVAPPQKQQAELIEKLAKAISNTKWTGAFTVTGQNSNPKTESYEIKDAQYQGDDRWLLTARIAYGERDVTVPIPLEIKWAGRTPVITVDNLTIPPLGTFDARVLMRHGSYAGTWAHGKKGGHLFGKYEKVEQPLTPTSDKQSP